MPQSANSIISSTSNDLLRTPAKHIIIKIRDTGYLSFINWVSAHDEHRGFVHIANFHHPEHGPCDAYVKLYETDVGKSLANEITAYLCAHALSITQPKHAFIANIPLDRIKNPPGWIKRLSKTHKTYPAFCTTRLDGHSAALRLPFESDLKHIVDDVAKWPELERAVTLDENLASTDRHLNNLIRLAPKKYALIDGGRLANDEDGCWTISTLNALNLYRNRLSERVWDHKPKQQCIDKMIDSASTHSVLLEQVAEELRYWWSQLLTPEDSVQFDKFLNDRTSNLGLLVRKRYGMLV